MGILQHYLNQLRDRLRGTSTPAPKPNFTADVSLLRDYTFDYQKAEAFQAPYLTHYHKGGKDLYYIASGHETGIESPTFQTVRKAMDAYKPQLVIFEGLPTERGISPPSFNKHLQKNAEDNFAHTYESTYAAYLAHERNIPFMGGEPADAAIFAQMETQGYSTKDMMAHYLLRGIPVWRNQGVLDEANFEKQARDFLENDPFFQTFPPEKRLTYEELQPWYERHATPGKTLLQLEQNDFAPLNKPDATYAERQSYKISEVRDKHLAATIGNAVAAHERVLVVYGSGHLIKSRPVWEAMFEEKGETVRLVEPSAPPAVIPYRENWSQQPRNAPGRASGHGIGSIA